MNKRYRYILTIGLLFGTGSLLAQQPLQAYQDTAALNNPGVLSLFKQYERAMQRVPQSGTLPDPEVGFGYFISSVETRVGPQQATFSVSQSFPWFGELNAKSESAEERAKAVLEQFNNERSKLNFNITATYNSLYVLRSDVRITKKSIELLSTFKDLARVRFESGSGSMVDVLRIEMELAELQDQLAFLEDSKQPLVVQFEELLNTTLQGEVALPEVLWTTNISRDKEEVMDSIRVQNPSILSLEHELLSYDKEVVAAQKEGGPDFTIGLNYTVVGENSAYTGSDNGKDAILPTIGVRIPLYRKKYEAQIKEMELARESVVLKKEDKVNELHTNLEKGFRDYRDAERRVALNTSLTDYAQQALDILIAEYTSGETRFEEVIRMQRKLLNYEMDLEKARADQNTAVAYVDFLMGN